MVGFFPTNEWKMCSDEFLVRRQWNEMSYSNEYFGLFIENNEKISMLTSHLIIGYEPLSLLSQISCEKQYSIKTSLKFVQNHRNQLMEKSFLSFVKSFSLFSCFYGILPGEFRQIDLLTFDLIYFYISLLILNEDKHLNELMQINGLHPIVNWSSKYFSHLILSQFYSLFMYFISSFNDEQQLKINSTFEEILRQTNLQTKNKFYLCSFVLSTTTLPFIYLLTSEFVFIDQNPFA